MEQSTLIIDIGSGSIKMLVGNELSGKPVILHTMQSDYYPILSGEKLLDPSKTAALIKSMYQDMRTHLGYDLDHIQVVISPIQLDVFHGEKRTNTVDPNGTIHPMDIQNIHSMFSKEIVAPSLKQVGIVPVSYQIDGGKTSLNPPLGEMTANILLQAYVQYVNAPFLTDIQSLFSSIGLPIKRYILDGQGIADMLETQYKDFPNTYVLLDHGAHQTYINLISQHKLIRSMVMETGSEQLTSLIAHRFQIEEKTARKLKETFGLETREQVFDGLIYKQGEQIILQSDLNSVIKEFYQALVEEINTILKAYEVDKHDVDISDLPIKIVGGGSNLIGIASLLKPLGQQQGVEKPYIKTIGARNIQVLSSLGGLRFAYRYRLIEDDVRHHVRLERQSPATKHRFTNYDEE
jgi:cell division ATPase FtsA